MKIKHTISGTQRSWTNDKNDAYINYNPAKAGSITDPYTAARVGDGRFMCVDNKDLVYSFPSLLAKHSTAPAYMRRMARRAKSDIDKGTP